MWIKAKQEKKFQKCKITIVPLLILVLLGSVWACQEKNEIVIGKTDSLFSKVLDETRVIEVYMPPDFEKSGENYPLLVVLDGGRFFQYCVSIIHMMSPNHFPRMIIIGILNNDRSRDLDPVNNTEKFRRFMETELFPYIQKKYRTLSYRILMGHSLAGLFTLHTLFKKPELFNAYIATSPSLGDPDSNRLIYEALNSLPATRLKGRFLYYSAGGEESGELHDAIRSLDKRLKTEKSFPLEWYFDIFEHEGHVPIKGFYQGLKRLFPHWIPSFQMFEKGSLADLKNHYKKNSAKYGFKVLPTAAILNAFASRCLREKKIKNVIEIYEYYVSVYPKNVYGFLALAEAYILDGQVTQARECVRKLLNLDPQNEKAQKMMKELKRYKGPGRN